MLIEGKTVELKQEYVDDIKKRPLLSQTVTVGNNVDDATDVSGWPPIKMPGE